MENQIQKLKRMNLFCIKLCMNMSIKTQLSCLRFLWFLNSTISLVHFVSIYLFLSLSGNKRDLMIDALKACFMNHMSAFQSRQICTHEKMQIIVLLYFICRDGTHKGVDIVCAVGSCVYAPFSARVVRGLTVYKRDKSPEHVGKPYDTGLELCGTGTWKGNEPKGMKC